MDRNKMHSIVVSTDDYAGIPVQKIKFDDGSFMYYSCGTWFEDFEDFKNTVDDAIAEENRAYTIDDSDFEEKQNPFEDWLFNDQPGGALNMLAGYAK